MLNAIALILHLVAINVWVGGTFFAIVILGRAIKNIAAAQQLLLWQLVLERFFTWAWVSTLPGSLCGSLRYNNTLRNLQGT